MSEQNGGSHEEIQELAGAAALRALTLDEGRLVARHLAGCPRCSALYRDLAATADLLLRAPEPLEPPADLRARIMAEIARTPQAAAATVPLADARDARSNGPTPLRRQRFGWRDWGMLGSMAAAVFLGFWTLRLQSELALQATQLAQLQPVVGAAVGGRVVPLTGTPAGPGVRGAVAETDRTTVVYLENLPQPSADRAYQVWLIPPGGQPIGAGVSAPGAGGRQTIPLDRPLTNVAQVAVTQEPAGGSPGPTSPPIVAGRI